MNELLSYFSRESRLDILITVIKYIIGPLLVLVVGVLLRKRHRRIKTGDITAGRDVNVAGRDIINNDRPTDEKQ